MKPVGLSLARFCLVQAVFSELTPKQRREIWGRCKRTALLMTSYLSRDDLDDFYEAFSSFSMEASERKGTFDLPSIIHLLGLEFPSLSFETTAETISE